MTMSQEVVQVAQVSRWVFTLNNYNYNLNYKDYLSREEFYIKRAVWGYERGGENNVPHLQGYVEFKRSVRLPHVKRVLQSAHWENAIHTPAANFSYCTKGGIFDTIGDFSKDSFSVQSTGKLSQVSVVKALLNDETRLQIKVSKEYSDKFQYFDKVANELKDSSDKRSFFDTYKKQKLYPWQYKVLKMLAEQGDRRILWIVDEVGNSGKSFLSRYMRVMYNFSLLDGSLSVRDLAHLVKGDEKGFCFDVNRDSAERFNYSTLESIKNGFLCTGKYAGKLVMFTPKPTVVFSNTFPNMTKLSADRWTVRQLGVGEFGDTAKDAVVCPARVFPFVVPPHVPELTEDFDFKSFLRSKTSSSSSPVPDVNDGAGPSGTGIPSEDIVSAMPPAAPVRRNIGIVIASGDASSTRVAPPLALIAPEPHPQVEPKRCTRHVHGGKY